VIPDWSSESSRLISRFSGAVNANTEEPLLAFDLALAQGTRGASAPAKGFRVSRSARRCGRAAGPGGLGEVCGPPVPQRRSSARTPLIYKEALEEKKVRRKNTAM
jgi:hypothetical protein